MAMAEIFFIHVERLRHGLHNRRHLQTRNEPLCSRVIVAPRLLRDDLPHALHPLRAAEVDLAEAWRRFDTLCRVAIGPTRSRGLTLLVGQMIAILPEDVLPFIASGCDVPEGAFEFRGLTLLDLPIRNHGDCQPSQGPQPWQHATYADCR